VIVEVEDSRRGTWGQLVGRRVEGQVAEKFLGNWECVLLQFSAHSREQNSRAVTREEESRSPTPFANGANGFGMTRYPTKAKCSDSDYVQR
jgi:hypothetical protein